MGIGIWHILVVLVVVLIAFGAGKLPNVMGDLGKGIRSFKAGLSGEGKEEESEDKNVEAGKSDKLPPPKA